MSPDCRSEKAAELRGKGIINGYPKSKGKGQFSKGESGEKGLQKFGWSNAGGGDYPNAEPLDQVQAFGGGHPIQINLYR